MTSVSQKLPSIGGTFAITYDRAVIRAMAPGAFTRLRARVRSGSFDRALIAGADPASRPELAARAAALNSRRNRAAPEPVSYSAQPAAHPQPAVAPDAGRGLSRATRRRRAASRG
jgi:hypothetical protein